MDIVITKKKIQTLVDVFIASSTHTNFVQHALTTTTHATIVVVQNKTQCYTTRMP
jgi:hypothetical protein